ncbi:nucleoside-diphosphate-sugar epimerase [Kribbella aluminosa]|uniref:Nucleoside-diphosphate-sugar epimerase n=1 Tax=Kribbella aluminosa TaxID=416017 RepID=A0ABS4UEI0_9ACTN|nr:NAD-dependent epimerase/dehydratase family protein [Kribbella aluminosa]MBP2350010.1 nucleoside-diphosphate-sugar epimerase [Kribbella aluminosa]
MRIFVAGASGVIGRRLGPLLVAEGHQLTTLSRRAAAPADAGAGPGDAGPDDSGPRGARPGGARPGGARPGEAGPVGGSAGGSVTRVVGDVYDREQLHRLVAVARPEVVMHQLTDLGARDFAANDRIRREGTRNLVDAALAAGVRRVISQSIAWAYEPGSAPADESTPLDLHSADEARRTTVEAVATLEAITAEAPEWVVLRYGMLYGPGTWYAKGGLMANSRLPTGPDITSFLHVDDAAEAATAALTWPSGPVNIVDDNPVPASTWSPIFTKSLNTPPPQPTHPRQAIAPTNTHPGQTFGTTTHPRQTPSTTNTHTHPGQAFGTTTHPGQTLGASTAYARAGWARGAGNARARGLGWSPVHPSFLAFLG